MPKGPAPDAVTPRGTRYAAGLDVHKYHVTACVAVQQGHDKAEREALQEFKTDPGELENLARFLARFPLRVIVMEATGVYSKPVKVALEQFEGWTSRPPIITFNPTDAKHFPGEIHEDKADALSMARFALMGLLRPSFVPEGVIRELRDLTREASIMTKESTRAKNRIKRVLAAWGLGLPDLDLENAWALDLFRAVDWAGGDFGKALGAIRDGEFPTPPSTRLALARREAVYAPFAPVTIPPTAHAVLRGYLLSYAANETLISRLAGEIEDLVARHPAIAAVAGQISRVDGLTSISAVSIIAEVGDSTRFPTVKHFLAYAGCAPTIHQSGTKVACGFLTKRANQFLKRTFFWAGKAIATLVKGDSDLKTYAKKLAQRRPGKTQRKLVWAITGAKVARIVFTLLRTSRPYTACNSAGDPDQRATDVPVGQKSDSFSLRDLRKHARHFVNFLNRAAADAPAKFQVVAKAFEKISWG